MMKSKVSVWVREVPFSEKFFWCVAMVIAIALFLALMIALWQFNTLGGATIGFVLCRLLRG